MRSIFSAQLVNTLTVYQSLQLFFDVLIAKKNNACNAKRFMKKGFLANNIKNGKIKMTKAKNYSTSK